MAMAETWILVAEYLESCIRQDASGSGPTFQLKKACYYHHAIVVEIATKIIWAIDMGAEIRKTHDILSLFKELSSEKQYCIKNLYDNQVSVLKVKGTKRDGSSVGVDNLVDFQSLEEALQSNYNTMTNFKYDGKFQGKSSAISGVIWSSNRIWVLPENYVTFPENLLAFAREDLES